MDLPVALQASTVAFLVLGACGLVILVFLVIAPWRTIQEEPPLPEEAETRLLLGEDFDEVDHELSIEDEAADSRVDGPEQRP